MKEKKRIVVAMSGGVDSSAVAALLLEEGHEVIGLSMKTHGLKPKANRACCTPDDMRDARAVADRLGIPFYILNYEDMFRQQVIVPFAKAYQAGLTPNPCVECNDKVKFRPLLERAKLLGADALATGHYARIACVGGHHYLQRGVDQKKDQSYFLYRLDQAQLGQLLFPLGGMCKDEVRAHAERLGLAVAQKQESQEICFVGQEGYARTVEEVLGEGGRAGAIVDEEGKVLGAHDGIHAFTIGQRRGLGIAAPEPLYVLGIDAAKGQVRVGPRESLLARELVIDQPFWPTGEPPAPHTPLWIQQRYREHPKEAVFLHADDGAAHCRFMEPTPAGAPGQAAVFYADDGRVLGGGTLGVSPCRMARQKDATGAVSSRQPGDRL